MTLVIAHRGASAYEPENSMAAFAAAVALGADGIELDVHAAGDGTLVVHHDPRLGGRPMSAWTRETLAASEIRLENGEPIPVLDDVLAAVAPPVILFIEVKSMDPRFDRVLLDAIAAAPDPARCHVHSFDHRIVRRLVGAADGLVGGALFASYQIDPVAPVLRCGADEVWQEQHLVDRDLVDAVHAAGKRLYAWTVDEPDRIEALRDLGVDGICSNTPDVVRRMLG